MVMLRVDLRRLECPTCGVVTEAVPFARHRSGFTRDLEDVAAYLATRTDKTTIARFLRLDWDSVGRICQRVAAHGRKKIVWGKPGKDTATLDAFFAELGNQRAAGLDAVSMDMGPAFARSVRTHAPQATSSKAPAGRCSNAPTTSPTTKPAPCASYATAAASCGAPTPCGRRSGPSSPAT